MGYGTQIRREVTGAVASVRGADIVEASVTPNIQTALQGRLAGVNVAESSGEPGAAPQVLVRGRGSISAGTEPLYVIDGVPYSMNTDLEGIIDQANPSHGVTRANPLANLNPNDIENIEVLKDAAAAAIYGSRGSNGVILITTKRGQMGMAPEVNYRAYGGRPDRVQPAGHDERPGADRVRAPLPEQRVHLRPGSPESGERLLQPPLRPEHERGAGGVRLQRQSQDP